MTPVPRAAWGVLAVLTAMNLLNYIDRYVVAAVLRPMAEELRLNETQSGWVLSAFLISYTVFSPLVCWLEGYLSRPRLLALGVVVWSLATACSGLATTYEEALAARAVIGIGEATYAVLAPALISDLFPRERRNRALTVFYLATPLGAALGYGVGALSAHLGNWRVAFFVVGLPGVLAALAALFLREPPRGATEEVSDADRAREQGRSRSWSDYGALVRNRSYVYNTLGMALFTFCMGGLQGFTPKFLAQERGLDDGTASLGLGAVVLVASLIGTPAGGLLGDYLTPRLRGAYFWLCGVSMLLAAPFILASILVPEPPALIFGLILLGLCLALMNYGPTNTILVNVTTPHRRAAAVALNLFLIHLLGDIPSPVLIGQIGDATGTLFWGMLLTVPALVASGVCYCLGAAHFQADQERVLEEMRAGGA